MADILIIDAITGIATERDFTPAELAQRQSDAVEASAQQAILDTIHTNRVTLEAQAQAALAQNNAALAANPNTVTLPQVAAHVQALTAQNNALIRLVLGLLDSVD